MLRKFMAVVLIGGSMAVAGCNTVRGVGEDVQSVANCTEEMMNRGEC